MSAPELPEHQQVHGGEVDAAMWRASLKLKNCINAGRA
jgi:hypothetical protein